MREFVAKWKKLLLDKKYLMLLVFGGVFCVFGQYAIIASAAYRDKLMSGAVTAGDLILDAIPALNLMPLYVYGPFVILLVLMIYLFVWKPYLFPYVLFTFGLIGLARAFSIQLTHLGPPHDIIISTDPELMENGFQYLFFKSDLFFSGHVANAFMAFLIVGRWSYLKWAFLFATFVMAFTVLAMHIHYSIDVFAAFFITYGVYRMARRMFREVNRRMGE